MGRRIGSLFSGAGGLDLAVQEVFGGEVVWHAEIDKAASKVLALRFPGVPNLGDISAVDWAEVPAVDVLCGGFPCTDVSAAGKRAGMHGTRSGLWSHMAEAIDVLRPRHVVIENVRGLLSANANRSMERAADDLGNGADRPVLRAIGAVLGDLADIGSYEARWVTVAAADVGAPHRRERVFILATDASGSGWHSRNTGAAFTDVSTSELALLPTPNASDGSGGGQHPDKREGHSRQLIDYVLAPSQWGKYAPAIARWESIVGPAPAPTEPNKNGNPRLSAAFSEWLMGWPQGWVTHPDIGISRNDQLRIIGNGVCPQQATAALNFLLAVATGTHTHTLGRADMTPKLPTPCARDHKDGDSAGVHARNTPSLGAVSAYFEVGE